MSTGVVGSLLSQAVPHHMMKVVWKIDLQEERSILDHGYKFMGLKWGQLSQMRACEGAELSRHGDWAGVRITGMTNSPLKVTQFKTNFSPLGSTC